jgi:uncharacterized membrane protein
MRYGDHFDHMDGGGWVFAAVMLVLLVALAVAAIVWLTRARHSDLTHTSIAGGEGSARELLDRRLVAGEIGEDEYRRLRATLAETPAPSASGDPPPKAL